MQRNTPGGAGSKTSQGIPGAHAPKQSDVPPRSKAFQRNTAAEAADIPPRSTAFHRVPSHSNLPEANEEFDGTKPPTRWLTPRQLAALRLLLAGKSSTETAGQLGIARQTVNTWRRDPLFAGELQRLHEMLVSNLLKSPRSASPASAPQPLPGRPSSARPDNPFLEEFFRKAGYSPRDP